MPAGKGTYGKKRGRPPTKKKRRSPIADEWLEKDDAGGLPGIAKKKTKKKAKAKKKPKKK